MNEKTFFTALEELEHICRTEYDDVERRGLKKDVLRAYHPSIGEWEEVISDLRRSFTWLPKVPDVVKAMQRVRKKKQVSMLEKRVPCNFSSRCEGYGFLMGERDGVKTVMGCGCDNTPRWVEYKHTMKFLVDKGIFSMEEITSVHRKPIMDLAGKHKTERWAKVIKLYKEDKWVPKFMRDRFDEGNFEYPTEWPGGQKETQEQLKDSPF